MLKYALIFGLSVLAFGFGRVAADDDEKGTLKIVNLDDRTYSLAVDEKDRKVLVQEKATVGMPYELGENKEIAFKLKEEDYRIIWQGEEGCVKFKIKESRITTITLTRGGESGRDLLAVVDRGDNDPKTGVLKGVPVVRTATTTTVATTPAVVVPAQTTTVVTQTVATPVVIAPAPVVYEPVIVVPAPVIVRPPIYMPPPRPYYPHHGPPPRGPGGVDIGIHIH